MTIANQTLERIADDVTRQMAYAFERSGMTFIKTPLLLPDGSSVVVTIEQSGRDFIVSDYGCAAQECDMMGATPQSFQKIAQKIAEKEGVSFDLRSFFVLRITQQQLVGAVSVIANAVKETVDLVAMKIAEKSYNDDKKRLYDKIVDIFKKENVTRDVSFKGHSSHDWTFDLQLKNPGSHVVFFDFASKSPQSLYPVITKFGDISRLDNSPTCCAVVSKKADIDIGYINLIAQSGQIIELGAQPECYRSLIKAA